MQNWLNLGDYNCICDSCGRKFKASTMRKRWDGLLVCKEDYEPRHPQLSLKVHGDKQTVPIPRPEAADQFLEYCSIWTSSAYADLAEAGCALADNTRHTYAFLLNLKQASTIPKGTF